MSDRPSRPYTGAADMRVLALSSRATRAQLWLLGRAFPCALGRGGSRTLKREGDGASPAGTWRLLRVMYRRDRIQRPRTALQITGIKPSDGWCDATGDRNYNRPVTLPYPASTESLARTDNVYDVVVVLDHNARLRLRNRGSAIFLHLARPGYTPTEGCIALSLRDMRHLLAIVSSRSRIRIGGQT